MSLSTLKCQEIEECTDLPSVIAALIGGFTTLADHCTGCIEFEKKFDKWFAYGQLVSYTQIHNATQHIRCDIIRWRLDFAVSIILIDDLFENMGKRTYRMSSGKLISTFAHGESFDDIAHGINVTSNHINTETVDYYADCIKNMSKGLMDSSLYITTSVIVCRCESKFECTCCCCEPRCVSVCIGCACDCGCVCDVCDDVEPCDRSSVCMICK